MTGLSTLESVALLVVVAAAVYLYYHGPRVPTAGMGTPLSGPTDGSSPTSRACGPDCVVCPQCGAENAAAYVYCRRCLRRL